MNTKDFQQLIDQNDAEVQDMNRLLVFVRGDYALPWKVTERTYEHLRQRHTERLLECVRFTVTDTGAVQYHEPFKVKPRDVDAYKSGVYTLRDEHNRIMSNKRNSRLFRELMYDSPWSPEAESSDSGYALRSKAETELAKVIAEELHDSNCLDDYTLGVDLWHADKGYVTVSFRMTLEQVQDLLKQKASV